VIALKRKYADLSHIQPENILYVGFSKKKSNQPCNIKAVNNEWSLFRNEAFMITVHVESWDQMIEADRYYSLYKQLLRIPENGFSEGTKEYKKLIRPDLTDFKSLVHEFGVYKENINRIMDGIDPKEALKKLEEELDKEIRVLDEEPVDG
jgi:hypothetical protein